MEENPESQEKKGTKKVLFEVPGVVKEGPTGESGIKPEEKVKQKETGGEFTEETSLERKEPEENDFKASGAETGYTEKSWEKPERDMKEEEGSVRGVLSHRQEVPECEFKAQGELETGYTEKSWEKPEKDMGEKETIGESRTETKEEAREKTRRETAEEKTTIYTIQRRLTKSKTERKIFGVCGGLGEYFGIDPTLVRLAFVVLTLLNGIGLVLYIILAVIMPPSEESVEMVPVARK